MATRKWRADYTSLTVHAPDGRALPLKFGVVETTEGPVLATQIDEVVEFDVHPADLNRLISGLLRHRDSINGHSDG